MYLFQNIIIGIWIKNIPKEFLPISESNLLDIKFLFCIKNVMTANEYINDVIFIAATASPIMLKFKNKKYDSTFDNIYVTKIKIIDICGFIFTL